MALEADFRTDTFAINPLGPALGAEVVGLDLSKPLSAEDEAAVKQAFQTYHLLCFRDQVFTAEEQVAFSELFGPLEVFPEKDKTKGESTVYNVANVSAVGEQLDPNDHRVIYQKVNLRWHTDSSYRYIPSLASLMYGQEVIPEGATGGGGETEFSNMLLAYAALSDEMKARIEPLHMVHYYEFGRRIYPQLPPVSHDERIEVPPTCHPLVRVHADRDHARSLFITTNTGNEISGMTLEDGQAFHQELNEYVSSAEFCYKHKWRTNDLVMWDNRVLLHRAKEYDMQRYRRAFRRTTVGGSAPILGPYSQAVLNAK
jgi:alpha-ketoglutarate-dependent taurine dioxygenase